MRRAVFLDRDGVINRAVVRDGQPYPPATLAELDILPGVAEALAQLRAAGFVLVVVTNQPDVARGITSRSEIEVIHATLRAQLPIDDIRACYHDDLDACACRKPSPGSIFAAAIAHDIVLARSFFIGDRWRDIGAGRAAGCTTILVDGGHREACVIEPDARAADVRAAAGWILSGQGESLHAQ